jgi:hypothetical protein
MSKKKSESLTDVLARVSRALVDQAYAKGKKDAFDLAVQITKRGGYRNAEEIVAAIEEAANMPAENTSTSVEPHPPAAESYQTGMDLFS